MTELDDSDISLPSPPPKGDLVLISDASTEASTITYALKQRGFNVAPTPLAQLESRMLAESPRVMIVDIDQPGVFEALERVGDVAIDHGVELVFMGDPQRASTLRALGAPGRLFRRPVDVDELIDYVALHATPAHHVSQVMESVAPEPSSHKDTIPPPTHDSDSPEPSDYLSNQDPFDIESILPFGEEVLKAPADLPTQLSPELEQLMIAAERRVGTLVHRSSMPPPDEGDTPLPQEFVSTLDEPLESEEYDEHTGFGLADDEPPSDPMSSELPLSEPPEDLAQLVPEPVPPPPPPTPTPSDDIPPTPLDADRAATSRDAERLSFGGSPSGPGGAELPSFREAASRPAVSVVESRRRGAEETAPSRAAAEPPIPPPARLPEETPKAGTYIGSQLEEMSRRAAAESAAQARGTRPGIPPPSLRAQVTAPGLSGPMSHGLTTEAVSPPSHAIVTDVGRRSAATSPDAGRRTAATSPGVTPRAPASPVGPPPSPWEQTAREPAWPPPPVVAATPAAPPAPPAPPPKPPKFPPPPVPPSAAARPEAARPEAARPEAARPEASKIPSALGDGDAPLALARAIAGRVTGSLALTTERGVRRIVLQDGDVVTVGSLVPDETLLAFLVSRGDIERDTAAQLEGKLQPFGHLVGAALIAHGYLGQDDLWPVLRAHAEWVICRAILAPSGTCELEAEPPGRLKYEPRLFGGATGAEVLLEAIRRVIPPDVALQRLGGPGARIDAGPHAGLLGECALRRDEEDMIRGARGRPVGEIVRAGEPETVSVLYALACLGVIAALPPATPERDDAPEGPDPYDDEAIRQRVRARIALVEEGDYFSLLGVPRSATSYEIRRAYLELRRAFEPSRLLTAATADLRDDVRLVVEVLDEAYDILREPHRRERYRKAIESTGPS